MKRRRITVIDRYFSEEPGELERFVKRETNYRTFLEMLEAEQNISFTQCEQDANCFDCCSRDDEVTITRPQLRQLGEEIIKLSEYYVDQDEARHNSPEQKELRRLRRNGRSNS